MPLLSVVIPTFNRADTVGRAIRSVLDQTLTDLELIVVDDGSTDETERVVRSFDDPRLRYVRQENAGRCAARNAGARVATGPLLTFLDSDDEALPEWLAAFAAELADPRVGVACCGVRAVVDRPHLGIEGAVSDRMPRELGALYGGYRGLFLSGSFALRREIFLALGGYEETLHYAENTDLTHRLVAYLRGHPREVRCVDRALVVYYVTRGAGTKESCGHRLHAVEHVLARHGDRYLEHNRQGYSSWCAVAGVNAVRLGNLARARRHFLAAIRVYPWYPAHYWRLALSFLPAVFRGWLIASWQSADS